LTPGWRAGNRGLPRPVPAGGSRDREGARPVWRYIVRVVVKAPFDVTAFLREDRRPAQVASVSAAGTPLLGSLWFLFERKRFWFSSAESAPLPRAAQRGAPVAVIVDDFDPPAAIRQVRVRGRAQIEPHDSAVVHRIYQRYLGADVGKWPPFFRSRVDQTDGWVLWSVHPDTGLAVTFPGFEERSYRWDRNGDAPFT
jgi:Pyridoxamine 5'-phosphate oxidase